MQDATATGAPSVSLKTLTGPNVVLVVERGAVVSVVPLVDGPLVVLVGGC